MGTAVATVQQMQSYIQKVNPAVPKSVIDMVEYYISEGKTEGVRGDIAFAQSCLETGNFTFNGSAVTLDQNNFAGIGVTKNGMKGNSFSHPWIGIRAQIQHLKAYASNEKLYGVCVDPRFCYVKRGIAPYVEWLGIQENPQGGGWAAGKNYGSKILEILAKIIAMPEVNKEDVTMNLNTSLISNNNSYANQVPKYIVIHNTDNFAKGANAKAHAKAQHDGNFSGYSAHVYVDDTEAYQATPFNRGAWHVGVNYGGGLFGICNNHNSIGIEMCVQAGYNYDKAFRNTVEICKMLMQKFGIDADHVVSHYDVCAKNCPSSICREPSHIIDIFPTCLDIASAHYPDTFHNQKVKLAGTSLLPAIRKQKIQPRDLFFEHQTSCAILSDGWKLVRANGRQPWELIHLTTDPFETQDLSEQFPLKAKELENKWTRWAEQQHVYPFEYRPWTERINYYQSLYPDQKGKEN